MGIGRGLAALGALAGGYVQGDRMLKQDEERKAETDWKTEERNRLRQNWTLEDNKRNAITEAYRPRTAADGVVTDGAKGAETVVVNPVDTVALNAPQAQNTRAVEALRSSGDPMAAMSLENSLRANELGGIQLATAKTNAENAKADRVAKLKNEGIVQAAKASLTGNPAAVRAAWNAQGGSKMDADPIVKPRDIEIPGYGKVKSFDYEGSYTDEQGNKVPFKVNSHELNMSMMQYKDMLGMGKDAAAHDLKVKESDRQDAELGLKKQANARDAAKSGRESKEFTLSDGQIRYEKVKQPDGTYKTVPIAGTAKKSPDKEVAENTALLDNLAKSGIGGTKDIMTGVIKPDALTAKAADRVTQYTESGMSLTAAKAKVADEMKAAGLLK